MRKYLSVNINELTPYENNPKIHTDEQVDKIINSINEFGFTNPVLIDENNMILAGHGRVMAGKKMGLEEVPCLVIDGLNDAQKKALVIADNKLAEDAEWNEELLNKELEELKNMDFDISITGFDDDFITEAVEENEAEEDDYELEIPEEPKSKLGDKYKLGNNVLVCGDSTKTEDLDLLLGNELVDLCVTDPPYNVNIQNSQGMTIKNDDMDKESFGEFLRNSFNNLQKALRPGASFYIFYSESEAINFRKSLDENFLKVSQSLVWNKNRFVLSRQDYQNKYEPILYGWKEGQAHYFIDDRTQTSVIEDKLDLDKLKKEELRDILKEMLADTIPTDVIDEERPLKNDLHPTMKPIKLLARLIKNSSKPGEKVLDLFGGSGSTLIACEQLDRPCYIMEYDPKYVDVIIDRWEQLTGKKAIKL